jgi:hypothetical protein
MYNFFKCCYFLGVCTSKYLFTNVNIGFSGQLHDFRVFSNSALAMNILSHGPNALFYFKYHLLSDLAYSNRSWLVTPFKNYGNLSIRHKKLLNTVKQEYQLKIHLVY